MENSRVALNCNERRNPIVSWGLGLISALWATLAVVALAQAEDVAGEIEKDLVLRALVDELDRNMGGLQLQDLQRPYFMEFELLDAASGIVSAELGAVTNRDERRGRWLRVDIRVGSYELDNTNFRGSSGTFGGFGGEVAIPIEDDQTAIRQGIWWITDRQYKEAVEQLAEKKAFMAGRMIEDKPADFSREEPAQYFEERVELSLEVDRLVALAVPLSAVFRDIPQVKESSVTLTGGIGVKYLVNSESTRIRTSHRRFSLSVMAKVQADDGMELSANYQIDARELDQFPHLEEMTIACRTLADKLIKLRNAPVLESYSGPVLFEAEASTALFQRFYAPRFSGGQRPVGSKTHPEDFANKLNKRVLPRFVSVVDDPTRDTIDGVPVMGSFRFDDQGVKAKPVTLVENGRLVAQLMSRNPSKVFARSTGHGRGPFGPRATYGCLIVNATQSLDTQGLREELLDAVQDEGLPFGLRIASLGGGGEGGRDATGGATPMLMYKVYSDGREELVRGAEFARIDLRSFKRILAVGNTLHVLNSSQGSIGQTICAPAMLFEELDLARVDRDFDRPPVLPSAVARANAR